MLWLNTRELCPVRRCVSYYEDRGTEADLKAILIDKGLLHLTGMAGSGKTQLSRRIIHLVVAEYGLDPQRQTVQIDASYMTQGTAEFVRDVLLQPMNQIKMILFDNVTEKNMHYVNEIINPNIFCIIVTKSDLFSYQNVAEMVHGMSLGQINRLINKFGLNMSHNELNKLYSKFHGLPLSVVSAVKHMRSNQSTLSEYLEDLKDGYTKCCFTEAEYDVGFVEAVNRDIRKIFAELTLQERSFLCSIAYMGKSVPIDVMYSHMHQPEKKEIIVSRILDTVGSRSLASIYRDKGRMIELYDFVKEIIISQTNKEHSFVKNALKVVNKAFSKDVRVKQDFYLQQHLLANCSDLLNHYTVQLKCKPDLETKIVMAELWDKVGHMHCRNGSPENAEKAFDIALHNFDKTFICPGKRKLPLKVRIMNSESSALATELCADIKGIMANWPDDVKYIFNNFVDDKVCHQIVSKYDLVYWRKGLTKREDSVFEGDSRNMSPVTYELLRGKGMALNLEIIRQIYPFEMLISHLYSRGRLYFYCKDIMHQKLAERLFEICETLCRHVQDTYRVNLLHDMLCQTKGTLRFLVNEEEPDIQKQSRNCFVAINANIAFQNSNKKYFEFGLVKHHGREPRYSSYIFLTHILEARQLIMRNNDDLAMFSSAKNDLNMLEDLLKEDMQDLTHLVRILNIMGKMWLEISNHTKQNRDFGKANYLFFEVCKIVSTTDNVLLLRKLSAIWLESLTALKHLFIEDKCENFDLRTRITEYLNKCRMADLDPEPAEVLLREVELGKISTCLTCVENFESLL